MTKLYVAHQNPNICIFKPFLFIMNKHTKWNKCPCFLHGNTLYNPSSLIVLKNNTMSFLYKKFYEILRSSLGGVGLTKCLLFHSINGQKSMFKRIKIPRKIIEQNLLLLCSSSNCVLYKGFITYKIWWNSEQGFKKSCIDKQEAHVPHCSPEQ